VAISPEITLGSSYRVIWCNCAKNPRFKDSSEWCEWCRCVKCGAKRSKVWSEASPELEFDVNIDLFLVLVVYGAVAYAVYCVEDYPYLYLHIAGFVAMAHLIRNYFSTFTYRL